MRIKATVQAAQFIVEATNGDEICTYEVKESSFTLDVGQLIASIGDLGQLVRSIKAQCEADGAQREVPADATDAPVEGAHSIYVQALADAALELANALAADQLCDTPSLRNAVHNARSLCKQRVIDRHELLEVASRLTSAVGSRFTQHVPVQAAYLALVDARRDLRAN